MGVFELYNLEEYSLHKLYFNKTDYKKTQRKAPWAPLAWMREQDEGRDDLKPIHRQGQCRQKRVVSFLHYCPQHKDFF